MPASILNSDTFMISSKNVDQAYRILVGLPDGYPGSAQEHYSVIYVLDADAGMGLMTDMARALALGDEIPNALVVGIGYPVESFLSTMPMRFRDMTPTQSDDSAKDVLRKLGSNEDDFVGSGGARPFLRFIIEELIPQVETRYNVVSTQKAIWGSSLGGLFAAYALLSGAPFDGYIIESPSLWWDDSSISILLDESEVNVAASRVFMAIGALEGTSQPLMEFAKMIERKWKAISLSMVEFEDETHLSCIGPAVSRGLRWALPPSR